MTDICEKCGAAKEYYIESECDRGCCGGDKIYLPHDCMNTYKAVLAHLQTMLQENLDEIADLKQRLANLESKKAQHEKHFPNE